MTKDELIAKQQLEIEELNIICTAQKRALEQINNNLICIGGPLNDNVDLYTPQQKKRFFRIKSIIDESPDWEY